MTAEEFADEMASEQEGRERGMLWRRRVSAIKARDAELAALRPLDRIAKALEVLADEALERKAAAAKARRW
jgi:hypothetical protein